jgi:hypothetical protein
MRPDRDNPAISEFDLVNRFGAEFDPATNEFQSVSQGNEDDPATSTDPAFVAQITSRLTSLGVTTAGSPELLNRAGAMTCGGCHQFSNGMALSTGPTPAHWPSSAGFVHINESGGLSQTLTSFFLPRRSQILSRFVCNPTAEAKPTPPCPPNATALVASPLRALRAAAALGPLPSKAGLAPALESTLRKGRRAALFKAVDDARMSALAAGRRVLVAPAAARAPAAAEAQRGDAILEQAIERARVEERSLPGAFVSVRRVH